MVPDAAGMEPGRAARHDLQRLGRRAGRRQHRERVALGVEGVDLLAAGDQWRPPPSALRQAAAHAGGGDELVLGPVAAEDLADLEQRDIGKAAVGVLLRRRDEAGHEARPHVGQLGGDRIGERERRIAAAEQLGLPSSR